MEDLALLVLYPRTLPRSTVDFPRPPPKSPCPSSQQNPQPKAQVSLGRSPWPRRPATAQLHAALSASWVRATRGVRVSAPSRLVSRPAGAQKNLPYSYVKINKILKSKLKTKLHAKSQLLGCLKAKTKQSLRFHRLF